MVARRLGLVALVSVLSVAAVEAWVSAPAVPAGSRPNELPDVLTPTEAEDPSWAVALIMLAAFTHGQDYRTLADVTGQPYRLVARTGSVLKRNRLWLKGGKFDRELADGVGFMLGVCVAMGWMGVAR